MYLQYSIQFLPYSTDVHHCFTKSSLVEGNVFDIEIIFSISYNYFLPTYLFHNFNNFCRILEHCEKKYKISYFKSQIFNNKKKLFEIVILFWKRSVGKWTLSDWYFSYITGEVCVCQWQSFPRRDLQWQNLPPRPGQQCLHIPRHCSSHHFVWYQIYYWWSVLRISKGMNIL